MDCPTCAKEGTPARLVVRATRQDSYAPRVIRRRVCEQQRDHVFETTEQLGGPLLDHLVVRRSGDKQLGDRFSVSRLRYDLGEGVFGRLKDLELDQVVADVCASLQEQVSSSTLLIAADDLDPSKYKGSPPPVGAIDDVTIRREVERRLRRSSNEVAHVLYALSFRGRTDISGSKGGFQNAEHFLVWMFTEGGYSSLARDIPPRKRLPHVDSWWPPEVSAPQPGRVVGNDGYSLPFDRGRFENTIRKALLGRQRGTKRTTLVAEWVLWGLLGQDTVLTGQLSAGVMSCLRRFDDIAYLRYAAIAKEYREVGGIRDEAIALITQPLPQLRFDKAAPTRLAPVETQIAQGRAERLAQRAGRQ